MPQRQHPWTSPPAGDAAAAAAILTAFPAGYPGSPPLLRQPRLSTRNCLAGVAEERTNESKKGAWLASGGGGTCPGSSAVAKEEKKERFFSCKGLSGRGFPCAPSSLLAFLSGGWEGEEGPPPRTASVCCPDKEEVEGQRLMEKLSTFLGCFFPPDVATKLHVP